jgi:hypothetical protein
VFSYNPVKEEIEKVCFLPIARHIRKDRLCTDIEDWGELACCLLKESGEYQEQSDTWVSAS